MATFTGSKEFPQWLQDENDNSDFQVQSILEMQSDRHNLAIE